jgi:hypothetical protein
MNEQVIPAGAQVINAQPSVDYNIFIQELTTMTKKFDMFLMGYEEIEDENRNKVMVKTSNAKMNIHGRKAVMSWVHNYINPNTYLAENKEHNVQAIYKLDNINTLTLLYTHLNEFELTIEDANDVHSQLCALMMHALQRSMTDKKYIFPTINTSYNQQQPQQEKPKLWGLF